MFCASTFSTYPKRPVPADFPWVCREDRQVAVPSRRARAAASDRSRSPAPGKQRGTRQGAAVTCSVRSAPRVPDARREVLADPSGTRKSLPPQAKP
jgi:hypothetical protein